MAATFVLGQGRTREIGLITENDCIHPQRTTSIINGLEILSVLAKNNRESKQKIVEFRIGQLIYNPQFINKGAIAVIDRPLQAIIFAEKASFSK
jgi:hypothetical protein